MTAALQNIIFQPVSTWCFRFPGTVIIRSKGDQWNIVAAWSCRRYSRAWRVSIGDSRTTPGEMPSWRWVKCTLFRIPRRSWLQPYRIARPTINFISLTHWQIALAFLCIATNYVIFVFSFSSASKDFNYYKRNIVCKIWHM